MVDITPAFVVKGDLISGKVLIDDATEVQGRHFVQLVKKNWVIVRLLGFKTSDKGESTGRILSSTDIIEQLTALKNSKYDEYCKPLVEDSLGIDDDDDGIDNKKKIKHKPRPDMPAIADIEAPGYEPKADLPAIEPRTMAVLMSGPSKPLQIELTPDNILYLQEVARAQSADGDIKRAAPKRTIDETPSCPGISFCHSGDTNIANKNE